MLCCVWNTLKQQTNKGVTLNNTDIGYTRENTAGDFRIAFRPIPNGIAI